MNSDKATQLNKIASRLFDAHYNGCNKQDPKNCDACSLTIGYDYGPNYAGWARVYVEAERPIPETWRNAFYDELVSDNQEYKKSLEESIRFFGVRWVNK